MKVQFTLETEALAEEFGKAPILYAAALKTNYFQKQTSKKNFG